MPPGRAGTLVFFLCRLFFFSVALAHRGFSFSPLRSSRPQLWMRSDRSWTTRTAKPPARRRRPSRTSRAPKVALNRNDSTRKVTTYSSSKVTRSSSVPRKYVGRKAEGSSRRPREPTLRAHLSPRLGSSHARVRLRVRRSRRRGIPPARRVRVARGERRARARLRRPRARGSAQARARRRGVLRDAARRRRRPRVLHADRVPRRPRRPRAPRSGRDSRCRRRRRRRRRRRTFPRERCSASSPRSRPRREAEARRRLRATATRQTRRRRARSGGSRRRARSSRGDTATRRPRSPRGRAGLGARAPRGVRRRDQGDVVRA